MSEQPELTTFRADGGLVFSLERTNINCNIFKRDDSKYLHFKGQ